MRSTRLHRPSPSLVISIIALVMALGGTSYAAMTLSRNSVGTRQLRNGAVTTAKLHPGAVTASRINPAGLIVPGAQHASSADSATNAAHATSADSASHATTAGTAGHATTADSATNAATAGLATAVPPLTFTPLSLQNGWTGGPFSTRTPAVARDVEGIVHLEGALAQAGTFNGAAFVLPAAERPGADAYLQVDMCNATSGRIYINASSGQVDIEVGGATTTGDAQCFTSLEGVTFPVG